MRTEKSSGQEGQLSSSIKWAINFSPIVLLICAVLAVYGYVSVFGFAFSNNQSDWSAFGSYIGGIFGPAISFFTLLAVLITVFLQRELLDSQRQEFSRMGLLQEKTFERQESQIIAAEAEMQKSRIAECQRGIIRLLEQQINNYSRKLDITADSTYRYLDRNPNDKAYADKMAEQAVSLQRAIDSLLGLCIEISISSYSSIDELKQSFGSKFIIIIDPKNSKA